MNVFMPSTHADTAVTAAVEDCTGEADEIHLHASIMEETKTHTHTHMRVHATKGLYRATQ